MRARKLKKKKTGARRQPSRLRRISRRCCGAESGARRNRRWHETVMASRRRWGRALLLLAHWQVAPGSIVSTPIALERAALQRAALTRMPFALARLRFARAPIAPVPTRSAFSRLRPVCTGRSCPRCRLDSLRRSKVLLRESGSSRTGIRPTCKESAERWISSSSFPLTKTAQKQIKGRNYSLMMARKKAWREISGEAVGENTSK